MKIEKGYIRVKDIAEKLNISPPSVIDFLEKLAREGLIVYEKGGRIELTEKGLSIGRELYERHEAVKKFIKVLLMVDDEEAERATCYIEHGIGEKTLNRIVKFIKFIEKCSSEFTTPFLSSLYKYYEGKEEVVCPKVESCNK